jgi:hypothetical protein
MSSEEKLIELERELQASLREPKHPPIVLVGVARVSEENATVSLEFPGRKLDEHYSYVEGATLASVFGDDATVASEQGHELKGLLVVPAALRDGRVLTVDGEPYKVERPLHSPNPLLRSRSSSFSPSLVRTLSLGSRSPESSSSTSSRTSSLGSRSPESSSSTSSRTSSPPSRRRLGDAGTRPGSRDILDPSVVFVTYPDLPDDHPLLSPLTDRETNRVNNIRLQFRVCSLALERPSFSSAFILVLILECVLYVGCPLFALLVVR